MYKIFFRNYYIDKIYNNITRYEIFYSPSMVRGDYLFWFYYSVLFPLIYTNENSAVFMIKRFISWILFECSFLTHCFVCVFRRNMFVSNTIQFLRKFILLRMLFIPPTLCAPFILMVGKPSINFKNQIYLGFCLFLKQVSKAKVEMNITI